MPHVVCVVTVDDSEAAIVLDSDMGPLHHAALHDVLRLARSGATPNPSTARLSARQWDVLRLLSEGWSNGDIAKRLGIAIGTVKAHLATVYAVLGVSNRFQAAIAAGTFERREYRPPAERDRMATVVVEHRPVPRGVYRA